MLYTIRLVWACVGVIILAYIALGWPIIQTKSVTAVLGYGWAGVMAVFTYFWYYFYESWRMDASTIFMGLMVRFSFIAWDQYDYMKKLKGLPLSDNPKQAAYRERSVLDHELTFFEYFSWQVFWVHAMAGSNMPVMDFLRIVDFRVFKEAGFDPAKDELPVVPLPTLLGVIVDVIRAAAIYFVSMLYFDPFNKVDAGWNPVLYSIYVALCVLLTKQKYHFCWHFVHIMLLTSGAGFEGKNKDGKIGWKKHWNINSFPAEIGEKSLYITFNWNMTVNTWLKHYFHDRLDNSYSRSMKLVLTRIAGSAFHGVQSGYHVFFALTIPQSLYLDNVLEYYFGKSKDFSDKGDHLRSWGVYLTKTFFTVWVVNSYGTALIWSKSRDYLRLFGAMMWAPQIILFLSFLIHTMVVVPAKKKDRQRTPTTGKKTD